MSPTARIYTIALGFNALAGLGYFLAWDYWLIVTMALEGIILIACEVLLDL